MKDTKEKGKKEKKKGNRKDDKTIFREEYTGC